MSSEFGNFVLGIGRIWEFCLCNGNTWLVSEIRIVALLLREKLQWFDREGAGV